MEQCSVIRVLARLLLGVDWSPMSVDDIMADSTLDRAAVENARH